MPSFISMVIRAGVFLLALSMPLKEAIGADIDLFKYGAGGSSSRPNVLIMLDNTANWSPMFTAEKSALKTILRDGLEPNVFRLGLMMFVETGGGNDNKDGSYMRFAIRDFDDVTADGQTPNYSIPADALYKVVSDLHILNDRSNNAVYGLAMNEAYKYFKGGDSYSRVQVKRDYKGNTYIQPGTNILGNAFSSNSTFTYSKPSSDSCQPNHIIIISNGKGSDNASATSTATSLLADQGGDTTTIAVTPNGFQSNVADEWARFMAREPVTYDDGSVEDKPKIITHTILVKDAGAPGGQYPDDWTAFLASVSENGGKGLALVTDGSEGQIKLALDKVFKEIQAINTVFAASALPISQTTRGTALNQVYMGVFRPEAQGTPRWTGNLKLYKIDTSSTGAFLADQNSNPIEDTQQGFIKPSAWSFWTDASSFWNQTYESGFYRYKDIAGLGLDNDKPDGNLVEKGGAAYRLRTAYSTSLSGRPIYTCVSSTGAACAENGTDALTSFTTSNSALSASALGIDKLVSVSSLTLDPATSTVTIATSSAHGFSQGNTVVISGANQSAYNGTFTIASVPTANSFTIVGIAQRPPLAPSGVTSVTATKAGGTTVGINTITRSGTTATVTTSASHTFSAGSTVSITGSSQDAYNGPKTVLAGGLTANQFTYTVTTSESPSATISLSSPKVCAYTTGLVTCSAGIKVPGSVSRSTGSTLVTVDFGSTNHGFSTGNKVLIEGVTPTAYNGAYTITKTGNKTFTYNVTVTTSPTSPESVSGMQVSNAATSLNLATLSRTGTTVSGTVSAASHGWNVNDIITFSGFGSDATEYNGSFTLTSASGISFQYTLPSNLITPDSPATGAIVATVAGSVNRDVLINWIRGENRLVDDNPSAVDTNVRGHLHGDVLHSDPVVINYGRNPVANSTNPLDPSKRDIMVYYGANDGMLHAVKGGRDLADGLEKWAYVAQDHFTALKDQYLASPSILSSARKEFMDGPLSVDIIDINGDRKYDANAGDKVRLYATMRRGGRGIHVLDVSSPDAAPSLLWRKSNTSDGYSELGQTWSRIGTGTVSINVGSEARDKRVAIFGLGYDAAANDPGSNGSSRQGTIGMGRGLMIVDAATGVPIWSKTITADDGSTICDVPADAALLDLSGDAKIDRIYLTDTCANVWRVDIGNPDSTTWTVKRLATLRGAGTPVAADMRKIFFRVDVARFREDPSKLAIVVGTGDREAPFDTTVVNGFYMLVDSTSDTCANCRVSSSVKPNGLIPADLCERNGTLSTTALSICNPTMQAGGSCDGKTSPDPNTGLTCYQQCLFDQMKAVDAAASCDASATGWKMTYTTTGEKTVNRPLIYGGYAFWGTNVPQSVLRNASQCTGLGEARVYMVEYESGIPYVTPTSSTFYTKIAGGGLPPAPVGAAVELDNGKGTTEVVITGSKLLAIPSASLQKRYRAYWYKVIEGKR